MFNIMEPTFNVRQQSGIYIGPTSDILPGVLPEDAWSSYPMPR